MTDNIDTVHGTKESEFTPAESKNSLLIIIIKGLWKENPGLCQLLGLCPLLAVTTTAVSALGLGIATTLVVILSSTLISCLRSVIFTEVRIPIYVIVIATLVTVVRFYVESYFPELYNALGILSCPNCHQLHHHGTS